MMDMWLTNQDTCITLYMSCKEGDEDKLYNSLPLWLTNLGKIQKTHMGIFITLYENYEEYK
jgi:hypothetical protein